MPRLIWDDDRLKTIEYGVDRGVLYVDGLDRGVAWNGLTNVSTNTTASAPKPLYIDGFKYHVESTPLDFSATIEAFTYPEEFERCEGIGYTSSGVGLDTQRQQSFGLSYRTKTKAASSDTEHYKIHVVYNAIASPSDRNNSTVSEDVELLKFSWDVTTTPVLLHGRFPVSHIILDSRRIKTDAFENVENILYGTSTTRASLPSLPDLVKLIDDWEAFQIAPRTSGVAKLVPEGFDDLSGNINHGIFSRHSNSRLKPTTIPGIYKLEN